MPSDTQGGGAQNPSQGSMQQQIQNLTKGTPVTLKNNPGQKYVFWDKQGSDILVVPEAQFSSHQRGKESSNPSATPSGVMTVSANDISIESGSGSARNT